MPDRLPNGTLRLLRVKLVACLNILELSNCGGSTVAQLVQEAVDSLPDLGRKDPTCRSRVGRPVPEPDGDELGSSQR